MQKWQSKQEIQEEIPGPVKETVDAKSCSNMTKEPIVNNYGQEDVQYLNPKIHIHIVQATDSSYWQTCWSSLWVHESAGSSP